MVLHDLETLNRALFLAINATPSTPAWLIEAASAAANDLIGTVPLMLAILWLTGHAHWRETALKACVAAFAALGVNQLIGLAWQHPRPFMIGLGHTFLAHAPDSSFPSDHMTVFSAVAITLLAGRMTRLGTLTAAAGIAVAWARVFLGVHFPFDMIGAVAVAAAVYAVIALIWRHGGTAVTTLAIATHRRLFATPIRRGWLRP